MSWKLFQDGISASRILDNGSIESRLISAIDAAELVTALPVDPPTPEQLRAAIQSQIDQLEAKYQLARPVREFMLLSSVEKAALLGYTEPQLYAANLAYKAVKDFDAQITALRISMEAIV